jgi:hypothetical protein
MISVVDNAFHQLTQAAWHLKAEAHAVDMTGWRMVDEVEVFQLDDGTFIVRVMEPDAPPKRKRSKAAPDAEPEGEAE